MAASSASLPLLHFPHGLPALESIRDYLYKIQYMKASEALGGLQQLLAPVKYSPSEVAALVQDPDYRTANLQNLKNTIQQQRQKHWGPREEVEQLERASQITICEDGY